MKKTLAAVAVLGAFAGSALAADVTLYGKIDLGLQYTNVDNGSKTTENWGMASGSNSSSRVGLKGSEQISEGLTVGFQYEKGIKADTGANGGSQAFDRESRLYVATDFGELAMGRMGNLNSGNGTYGIMGKASAFGTAWGDFVGGHNIAFGFAGTRYDNTVTYKSPAFAGTTVYAQYAMGDSDENTSKANRYAALGVTSDFGPLHAVLVVDQLNKKSYGFTADEIKDGAKPVHDQYTVTGGMTYDFGVLTAGLTAQYFNHVSAIESKLVKDGDKAVKFKGDLKGYGVALSASAPVAGGTLKALVGYLDAEDDLRDKDNDAQRYNAGVTYEYPLSKRTSVYAGAGFVKEEAGKTEYKGTQVISGLVHNF